MSTDILAEDDAAAVTMPHGTSTSTSAWGTSHMRTSPAAVASNRVTLSFADAMKEDQLESDAAAAAELYRELSGIPEPPKDNSKLATLNVEWSCFACTFLNAADAGICAICESSRPLPPATATAPGAELVARAGAGAGAQAEVEAIAIAGPVEMEAALAATETAGLTDYEMALLVQAQFDEEHDVHITELEAKANRNRGNIRVSYDNFRSAQIFHEPARREGGDSAEGVASDDDQEDEAQIQVTYDQSIKGMRTADGQVLTKHNREVESRRNLERMGTAFPLSFPSGDIHRKDFKVRVTTKVYNKLKVNAVSREKTRHRVRDKKERSTSALALDTKTRLILFRMVNSGLLEGINGAISTGKEAVVFHAVRRVDPEDPDSATEDVAIKVFKTTVTEFKQRQQFLHGDRRFEDRVGKQSARKLVKLWAEKEMANLNRMARAGLCCPSVIKYDKHVLVMTFVGENGMAARKLRDVKMGKKLATDCFQQVKDAMKQMYHECRLVHADLSEYNILYHNKKVWVIDVGQAVEQNHPRAYEYLFRDCLQISRFFKGIGVKDVPEPRALFTEVCAEPISAEQELEFQQTMNASKGGIKRGTVNEATNVTDSVAFMPISRANASEVLDINAEAAAADGGSANDDDGDSDDPDDPDDSDEEDEEEDEEDEVYEEEVGDVHPEVAAARAAGRIGKGKVKTCFRCGSFNHKIKDCMVQLATE